MIIDFHTHCFPDDLAYKAIPQLAKEGGVSPYCDGTLSNLKSSMKVAGISKSVVQPIATKPQQTQSVNQWVANISDDSIVRFGTIHPDYNDWEQEIDRLKAYGFKGIKFHPEYQNFYVDDERIFPIYERLCSLGFIILFHAGIDVAFPEQCHCTPDRLRKMADRFKGAVIVAAHMGGFRCWDDVEKYLIGSNVYFDTSFAYNELQKANMERVIMEHGFQNILFASDSPWGDQAQEILNIKSLNLNNEQIDAILGNNARRLLSI